jgi:hypothetical protein
VVKRLAVLALCALSGVSLMDENVTVLKGTMMLGFGERFEAAALRELPAGTYADDPSRSARP